jgi:WD40 repeat protein
VGGRFSPNGTILVTSSADKTATLWDVSVPCNPRQLGTLAGHTNSVGAVAFSPDRQTDATGSWGKTAILWDVRDPVHLVRLDTHRPYHGR